MGSVAKPVVEWIRFQARERPGEIAVIAGDSRVTYGRLWRQVCAAAAWYHGRGVRKGDRILIRVDSRDAVVTAAYFGAHLAGAVAVPVDFRAKAELLAERRDFVGASLVLFGDSHLDFRNSVLEPGDGEPNDSEFALPSLSDVAEIMFTSGSTGRPKGVTLSHANIAESAKMIRDFVANTSSDTEVVTVPLTHSFGLGRLRATMIAGGTIVLVPGLTFPQIAINALREHEATGFACVPAGMRLLIARFRDTFAGLSDQLRFLEMGSAPFMPAEKRMLSELLPRTRLCMHYGLTEASRSAFTEFHSDKNHLDSVGRPSPGVDIKIVPVSADGEDHENALGLIHIRAPTVMEGYWNAEDLTSAALDRDTGWLNSGDLGRLDDDGYLHFAGRSDDVINCGGTKVLPDDVERYAMEVEGVTDCGCIGVPDPDETLGDVPFVCLAATETVDTSAVADHIRERLAHEISTVLVQLVDKLPRTESGKLLRRELAQFRTAD